MSEKTDDNISLTSINIDTVENKLNSKIVVYKGSWCYLKKINRSKLEITRSLLLQVKRVIQLLNKLFFAFQK
jgi:hypothetical protein